MSRLPGNIRSASGGVVFLACLALAGCRGCTSPGPGGGQATQPDSANPPVVTVSGTDGICDLGQVEPKSRHKVVFIVTNPADRAIRFKTVRPDCECISTQDRPEGVEPGGSVKITADYTAPAGNVNYEARLIIPTDNPDRRMISLRVKSGPRR